MKLPKWKMLMYGGDPHAWNSYWQSFTVAVHNQPIPDIMKMGYLMSSLKGEPLRDIQELAVTNENYLVAVRLLVDKYGDDGELEDKIHMEMQHLPAANESLPSLIELSQSFERYCQQLEQMRVSTCNPTITALLKAKIPKGARVRLTEKEAESGSRWDTDDWRRGLKLLIKIRKRNQVTSAPEPPKEKESKKQKSRNGKHGKHPIGEESRTFAVTEAPAKGKPLALSPSP